MLAQETLEDLAKRVREKRQAALGRKKAGPAARGYSPTDAEIKASVDRLFELIPATKGEYAKHVISSLLSGFTQGIGSMVKGPAVASAKQLNLVAGALGLPQMPTTAHPAYKLGEAIGGIGEAIVGPQESVRREGETAKFLAEDVPAGLGSIASFLVPGGVVGKLAGAATRSPAAVSKIAGLTAGVLGGEMQVGAVYDDLIAKGRSEEEASTAALLNFGVGATEAVPLGRMMGRLIRGGWGHYVKDALVEGSEEAIQSLVQQGGQNFIEKEVTDEDIDLMSGVLESGRAGGASALIASLLTSVIAGKPIPYVSGKVGRPRKPGSMGPEPFPMPEPSPKNDMPRRPVDPRMLTEAELALARTVSYDPEAPISIVEPETPLEHAMADFAQKQGAKILFAMPGKNFKGKIQGAYDKEHRTMLIKVDPKGDSKTWSVFLHEFAGHDFLNHIGEVDPVAAREFMTELMTTHREELNAHIKEYFEDEAAARGMASPRFTGIEGADAMAIEEGLAHLNEMSPIYMHMAFSSPENVRRLLDGKSRTVFHAMFDAIIRSLRGVFGVNLSTTYEKEIQNLEEANAAVSGYDALDPQARLALANRIFEGMEAIRKRRPVAEPVAPVAAESGGEAATGAVPEQPAGQAEEEAEVAPQDRPVPLDALTALGTGKETLLTVDKQPTFKPPETPEESLVEPDAEPVGTQAKIEAAPSQEAAGESAVPGGAEQEPAKAKRKVYPLRVGKATFRPTFASPVDEALYALTYGNKPKDADELRAFLDSKGIKTDRELRIRGGDVVARVRELANEQLMSQKPERDLQVEPVTEEGALKEKGMSESVGRQIEDLDAWYDYTRRKTAELQDPGIVTLIDRAYQNARSDIEAGRVEAGAVKSFADAELEALAEGFGREAGSETINLGEEVITLIEEADEVRDDTGGSRAKMAPGFSITHIRGKSGPTMYFNSYAPRQDNPRFVKDDFFIPGDTIRWTEALYDPKTKKQVAKQTITGIVNKIVMADGPSTYSIKVTESDAEDAPKGSTINRSSRALRLSMAERAAVRDEVERRRFADSIRPKPMFSYSRSGPGEQMPRQKWRLRQTRDFRGAHILLARQMKAAGLDLGRYSQDDVQRFWENALVAARAAVQHHGGDAKAASEDLSGSAAEVLAHLREAGSQDEYAGIQLDNAIFMTAARALEGDFLVPEIDKGVSGQMDWMAGGPQFSYQSRQTGERPGFMERVDENLFDEMRVWRDLVKKYGPEAKANPSLRETQYYGRGAERLKEVQDVREGLQNEGAKRGIDVWNSTEENPSFHDALLARHAPEANLHITETQDPDQKIFRGAGSGMTNYGAQDIMRRIRNSPNKDFYDKLFSEVDKVVNKGLERVAKAGVITDQTARGWRKKFKHYVPLLTIFEPDHSLPRPGTGFQPAADVTKTRRGRKTLPHNVFVSVFQQANRRIVMAEKNRIMKSAAEFVKSFPDKARWTIHDKRETLDLRAVQENRIVRFFEDGKEKWIEFANSRHASALLRTNVMYGSEWLKKLSSISRAYMSLYTRWNPFFPFTNFPRDFTQAGLNSFIDNERKGEFVKKMSKKVVPAMKMAWKLARNPDLKGVEYDEIRTWMNLGGRTGYIFTEDWPKLAKTVERDMTIATGRGPGALMTRAITNMFSLIEDANDAAEAATRYAVYKTAIEMGVPRDAAIVASKEITVNFNRQGRFGPAIKAAYFFGNPSLQGMKRYFQTLTSKKGLAVSSGLVGAGFVMSMLNRALADDDEDGENSWNARSSWEKARYLRLQIPGSTMAVGPPLPWGFNIPYYLGVQLEHTLSGHAKPHEAIADLFGETLDSMNPVGGANLVQAAFPSLLRPAVELTQNVDAFGRPIFPPESPWDTEAMPDHERHFQSINPAWKVMAKTMSDLSGGDSVEPGIVEVSPESLEHLGTFFMGGFLKGVANITTDVNDLMEGRPVRVRKVPVLSAYLSESYEGGPQMRFHAGVREVEKAAAIKKRAVTQGEPEDLMEFLESEEADVASLSKQSARAKIAYKKAREARDAATTPAARKAAEDRMHMIERSLKQSLEAVGGG